MTIPPFDLKGCIPCTFFRSDDDIDFFKKLEKHSFISNHDTLFNGNGSKTHFVKL